MDDLFIKVSLVSLNVRGVTNEERDLHNLVRNVADVVEVAPHERVDVELLVTEVEGLGVLAKVQVNGDVEILALKLGAVSIVRSGRGLVVYGDDHFVEVLERDGESVLVVLVLDVAPDAVEAAGIVLDPVDASERLGLLRAEVGKKEQEKKNLLFLVPPRCWRFALSYPPPSSCPQS